MKNKPLKNKPLKRKYKIRTPVGYLSISDAAEEMSVNHMWLRKRIATGLIKVHRMGKKTWVPQGEVDRVNHQGCD